MEKPLKFIALGIGILIASGVIYLSVTGKEQTTSMQTDTLQTTLPMTSTDMSSEQDAAKTQAQNTPTANTSEQAAGKYIEFTQSEFAQTAGTRILYFHATWCAQCRALEASIKAGQVPNNVTIFKVDYDSNQSLRQQYGVRLQTTLVLVDQSGNKVKEFVAYDSPTLDAVRQNLL